MASSLLLFCACVTFFFAYTLAAGVPVLTSCFAGTTSHYPTFVCLRIADATGTDVIFTISYVITGSGGTPTLRNTTKTTYFVSGLTPGTSYDFTVVGIDAGGVTSGPSAVVTRSTAALTNQPARLPALDIGNFNCIPGNNPITGRTTIVCSWLNPVAPAAAPTKVVLKGNCIGAKNVTRPNQLKRNIHNERIDKVAVRAPLTTWTLTISRHPAACIVYGQARFLATTPVLNTHDKKNNAAKGSRHPSPVNL
jgi:hypothetical protein